MVVVYGWLVEQDGVEDGKGFVEHYLYALLCALQFGLNCSFVTEGNTLRSSHESKCVESVILKNRPPENVLKMSNFYNQS